MTQERGGGGMVPDENVCRSLPTIDPPSQKSRASDSQATFQQGARNPPPPPRRIRILRAFVTEDRKSFRPKVQHEYVSSIFSGQSTTAPNQNKNRINRGQHFITFARIISISG